MWSTEHMTHDRSTRNNNIFKSWPEWFKSVELEVKTCSQLLMCTHWLMVLVGVAVDWTELDQTGLHCIWRCFTFSLSNNLWMFRLQTLDLDTASSQGLDHVGLGWGSSSSSCWIKSLSSPCETWSPTTVFSSQLDVRPEYQLLDVLTRIHLSSASYVPGGIITETTKDGNLSSWRWSEHHHYLNILVSTLVFGFISTQKSFWC